MDVDDEAGGGGSAQDAMIRWQAQSVTQMGFVNNLLITLGGGVLVFVFDQSTKPGGWEADVMGTALILVSLSVLVGVAVAWNRLHDYRLTAALARLRALNPSTPQRRGSADGGQLQDHVTSLASSRWRPKLLGGRSDMIEAVKGAGTPPTVDDVDGVSKKIREYIAIIGNRSWFGLRAQALTFVAGVVLIGVVDISVYLG